VTFRVLLAAAAALCLLAIGITLADGGGADAPATATTAAGTTAARRPAAPPAGLPGGGRSILPEHRVVAYYGAPQARELGILGGTPRGVCAARRAPTPGRAGAP
jgi:hypothetical protein